MKDNIELPVSDRQSEDESDGWENLSGSGDSTDKFDTEWGIKELVASLKIILEVGLDLRWLSESITWSESLQSASVEEALYLSLVALRETLSWMIEGEGGTGSNSGDSEEMVRDVMRQHFGQGLIKITSSELSFEVSLLRRRMKAGNWCSARVEQIILSASMLYWFSGARSYSPDDHSKCSTSRCIFTEVKEETYKTKHIEGCIGCESLGRNRVAIAEIISKGHVPVLSIALPEDAENNKKYLPCVEVLDLSDHPNYIAISHVWSDGLGNPAANSLPACQLQRIGRLVQNATLQPNQYDSMVEVLRASGALPNMACKTSVSKEIHQGQSRGVFWMDTLCVPVGNDIQNQTGFFTTDSLRKKAIQGMSSVYQDAEMVLVFDAGLLGREYNMFEKLVRVATSKWLTRMWTLQEAYFAGMALYFQFEDSVASITSIYWGLSEIEIDEYWQEKVLCLPDVERTM